MYHSWVTVVTASGGNGNEALCNSVDPHLPPLPALRSYLYILLYRFVKKGKVVPVLN
jgi:hypothetical protein